jgi:poly-gamma-glutamate capsule biosynthesis protein CapA/YwtB (metallophosphatase superfamily)
MKTKMLLFKHTFTILSIMCCLLLGSTSIMYAISEITYEIDISSINNSQNSAARDTGVKPYKSATNPATSTTDTTKKSTSEATSDNNSSIVANSENNSSAAYTSGNSSSATSTSENSSSVTSNSGKSSSVTSNSNSDFSSQTTTDDKALPSQDIPPGTITISAVGDLMAHQENINNAYSPKTGTYDFNGFLEYVKPYLTKSDLTIGNFETVTAGPSSGYTSYPLFNTPDAMLTALSNAGFDILSTANNHCLDRGISGLTRTIKKIEENKMSNVGSSIDGKNKYITKEINGVKVGILSYSYGFNGNDAKLSTKQKTIYLSPINEIQIEKDIKRVKSEGTDAIIVIMHWGAEYEREPSVTQTSLSNKMLSWGADIILGSHPHVIQKSEIIKIKGKDKFIIYSMGNFISGQRRSEKTKRPNTIYTEDGVIVHLSIQKDPKGGVTIKKVDYIPTWVDKNYINNRPVFKIIPILSPDFTGPYITDFNRNFIKQSYKNTMGIMAKLK